MCLKPVRGVRAREDLFDFQIPIFKKTPSVPQFPILQFLIPVLGDSRDIMSYFTFSTLPTCNTSWRVAWCTSMEDAGLACSCAGCVVQFWLGIQHGDDEATGLIKSSARVIWGVGNKWVIALVLCLIPSVKLQGRCLPVGLEKTIAFCQSGFS